MLSTRYVAPLVLAAGSLAASPAAAQIYAWRDARGVLHLSDRPREASSPGPVAHLPGRPPEVPGAAWPVEHAPDIVVSRPAVPGYPERFDPIITQAAAAHGVPADLVRAVVQVESGFNPRARSSKGAQGLMQLMPATAADLGVTDPFDPEQNIRGGVYYLRQLLDRYDNDVTLALAAYNAGPETVSRYGNRVPPYRETRNYVEQVTRRARTAPASGRTVIYKTIEIIDGRAVPRYSGEKPATGPYEIIDLRR